MAFEDTWSEIESDPEYQALKASNPQAAGKLVRKFARKVARQEVKGGDPRMASFLEKNLPATSGTRRAGLTEAAIAGAREGFDQSAVGMLANAATGRPQHAGPGALQSLKDAATGLLPGGGNSLIGEGALTGMAGAAGSMLGQAPDIIAGGGLAAAAGKGLARVGVKQLPAAVAASVGTNAITGAAVTKATGGTNSDAAKNAAVMGAAGLLPFAGRLPAGRLNPVIGRKPAAPPPAPAAAAVAPPPPVRPVDPATLARQKFQDARMIEDAARGILAKEYGSKPGTPQAIGLAAGQSAAADRLGAFPAPARPAIPADALPPEALAPYLPSRMAPPPDPFLDVPANAIGARPAVRPPQAAPPLALPPAGGTGWSGGVIPAPPIGKPPGLPGVMDAETYAARQWGERFALDEQIGHRPGTTAGTTPPRDTFLEDASPEDLARWLTTYKGKLTAARQNYTRLDNTIRADKQKRGGQSGVDESMQRMAWEDLQELPNRILELEAELTRRALRGQRVIEPAKRGQQQQGGGSLQRLARDEEGSMRLGIGSPSQAQAAGRAVRRGIGIAARTGLDGAARAGEPLRRGHEAIVGGVRKALDKTGVSTVTDGLAQAWELRKSPDWLPGNPVATAARRAFISDFGVPPELLQMAREASRQARREGSLLKQTAVTLSNSLDPASQAALDRQITEPGTPRSQMAEDVAGEAARLSQLLEDVGALSPEARQRWDGYYLPRIYRDKFPVVSGLVKSAAKAMKGHKARGTEKQMSPSAFEAERDAWEFRGYVGPGADKLARAESALEALQAERARITPGDHQALGRIDQQIEAATARQLDALATPGLKVRAWRDWTVEERTEMGEVRHASLRMLKLHQRFEQDFKTGRLLQEIASNPEWVQRIPKGVDPTAAPEGFVYFKDIDAAAPGGTKKWGAIAGHWVREDVAHYLRANIELPRNLAWVKSATGTNLWKRFVTLYNPSYFVNNAMVNVPTLELAGGSAFDLPAAGRDFLDGSELYQALDARGTLNNGQVARDLAMQMEATFARSPEASTAGPLEVLAALGSAAKKVEGGLGAVAQGTDDLFRLALVKRLMKPEAEGGRGMTLDQAADVAESSFYDPTRVTAPAAQYMEAFGLPFAKVLFYQLDRMPQLVLENPAKAATLTGYFVALEAILNAAAGISGDEAEGRKQLMPEYMRPRGNSLNLPMRDAYDNPLVLDTKNWNPLAFTETTDRTAIPGLPAALTPGGPLAIAGAVGSNYDAFRRKPIRNTEEDMGVQLGQVGGYLRDNALPTGIFNKAGKVADAAAGRADRAGRRYDMMTALANLVGVKVQPLDLDLAYDKESSKYEGKLRDLDAQIRAVQRDLDANPQDAATLEAEIQRLEARYERMEDERDKALDRADKAFPATPAPAPAGASR
ncbi:MAG: hypothetical protein KA744_01150 [Phenylobacterium sp.]|nr:hypothetical protein [Phenylobacterium sp.]